MIMAARALLARLRGDIGGVAAIEFALSAPIIFALFLSGAEITNYTITKLRISQIALHVADNGSRIGSDSDLSLKQVSEAQINDLMVGANLQAGGLDLLHRGRVILSSVEPMASPNQAKFRIHWQRCYGQKVYASSYGDEGKTNMTDIGPAGKQIKTVPDKGGVMYVEVAYDYKPLISGSLVPHSVITDTAAMVVRDDRDFDGVNHTGLYNTENALPSKCN